MTEFHYQLSCGCLIHDNSGELHKECISHELQHFRMLVSFLFLFILSNIMNSVSPRIQISRNKDLERQYQL